MKKVKLIQTIPQIKAGGLVYFQVRVRVWGEVRSFQEAIWRASV